MHRVETHLNGPFGSFVVEGWRYVARELTEILKAYNNCYFVTTLHLIHLM